MLPMCAPAFRRMAGEPLLTLWELAEGEGGARPSTRSGTRSVAGGAAMERGDMEEASVAGPGDTLGQMASPALPGVLVSLPGISGVALPLRVPEDSRCGRTGGDLGDDDREARGQPTGSGGVAPTTDVTAGCTVEGAAWHCILLDSMT